MTLTAKENVCTELAHWRNLSMRRALCEDEQAAYQTLQRVIQWMEEEQRQRDAIEAEAKAAEEQEEADENADTKALFESYRKKLKKEGRR